MKMEKLSGFILGLGGGRGGGGGGEGLYVKQF